MGNILSTWSNTNTGLDIEIPSGQSTTIDIDGARSIDSLTIHSTGELRVRNPSRKWAMLRVTGDVVIHGKISVQCLPTTENPELPSRIEETAPDGTKLSHTFIYKKGGKGGHGGTLGPAIGGEGELTLDYRRGGGGGGGGGNDGIRGGPYIQGNPGAGVKGGTAIPNHKHWGGGGGDGGQNEAIGDGGLLYLKIEGKLDGIGGVIDVRGKAGAAGKPGQSAPGAGGGGGGGAPGFPGGALFLSCGTIAVMPEVPKDKAQGGAGGKGAASLNTWPPGHPWNPTGLDGDNGDNGEMVQFKLILPPW